MPLGTPFFPFHLKGTKSFIKHLRPHPLISSQSKLAIFWSAKSASSFILKWFLSHEGLLNEANAHHHFTHKYRMDVFIHSEKYKNAVSDFINQKGKSYYKIKVVRNPFKRAVSSYIHYLVGVNREDVPMVKAFHGKSFGKEISFSAFLELLSSIDIAKSNPHWKLQFDHGKPPFDFDDILLVKDLRLKLDEIEGALNLKTIDDLSLFQVSKHHSVKSDDHSNEFIGERLFDHMIRGARPRYRQFFNDALFEKVEDIYQRDFKAMAKAGFDVRLFRQLD